MNDKDSQSHADRLQDLVKDLPEDVRVSLCAVLAEIAAAHEKRQQFVRRALDSLGELRLQIKYLTFDLEATRRENETLKQRLGE